MANEIPPPPPEEEIFGSDVPPPPPEEEVFGKQSFVQAATGAAKRVGQLMLGDVSKFNTPPSSTATNPFRASLERLAQPFEGVVGPSRVSALLREPGRIAGEATTNILQNEGVSPVKAKLAGTGLSIALDPQTYAVPPLGRAAVGAEKAALAAAGKEAATAASAVSGVKIRDIIQLFKNPKEVLTALSSKKAGELFGAAKKAAGITREEEFLISKAGDRSVGGARTVAEELRPLFEQTPENITTGQLLALRRASAKLAREAKGSETALWAPVVKAATQELQKRSVKLVSALEGYTNSKTKAAFMHVVPRTATNAARGDFFKTLLAGASMGLTSPLAVGAGTLAARAGTAVVNKTVANPKVMTSALLAAREALNRRQGR